MSTKRSRHTYGKENASFTMPFYAKNQSSFYQDRLGTNIGKTQNKDAFSLGRALTTPRGARTCTYALKNPKTSSCPPILFRQNDFTQTGTGPPREKQCNNRNGVMFPAVSTVLLYVSTAYLVYIGITRPRCITTRPARRTVTTSTSGPWR